MSKKMMKRSLALGALMAFVITGSAMAADYSGDKLYMQSDLSYDNLTIDSTDWTWGIYPNSGYKLSVSGDTLIDITRENDLSGIYAVGGSTVEFGTGSNEAVTTINVSTNTGSWEKATNGLFVSGSKGNNTSVTAKGASFNLYVENTNGDAAGINIDANSGNSYVKLNALENNIVVKSSGLNMAIYAVDNGKVETIGNLTVNANDGKGYAILTRNADIEINKDAKGVVKIDGDISFNGDYGIDSNVDITLNGVESYLNGDIYIEHANNASSNEFSGKVTGMNLTILDNATWTTDANSFVNNLKLDDGIIELTNVYEETNKNQQVLVGTATGDGTVLTHDLSNELIINSSELETLHVQAVGAAAEEVIVATGDERVEKLDYLANVVVEDVDESSDIRGVAVATTVGVAESEIVGAITADVSLDENGDTVISNVKEATNTTNQAIGEATVALKAHWHAHMNDMNKRMGELRNANGEAGVWTRMVRGEAEYESAKAQYNQYQLGYDEKLSVDKRWTVGAAVTFAEGDSSFGKGTTEDDSTAFAIYGSKLNDDGTFIDLIARYARVESDVTSYTGNTGDYSTNGYSVSAEFGKRIQQGNGLWIEPQVELTYGTIDSADYKLDGKDIHVGDMDSIIGRVGFSIGKDVKQGNVYARASYLYDFDGETETTFTANGITRPIEEDLGGGWWEVGVGANINLSKATYIYADVEKTFGGEVDINWQWNLGVRYSF